MRALRQRGITAPMWGVGGPRMRAEGLRSPIPMEDFQVMGFTDIVTALPRLWRHFRAIRRQILKHQPPVAIFIDYPGFNLRLERSLRKHGYQGKIVHFNSPMVWAHGQHRVHTLAEHVDLLISLLPFEKRYYASTPLRVDYVGHPLTAKVQQYTYAPEWRSEASIPSNAPLFGLFPGSRLGEIRRNLPHQLQAAAYISSRFPDFRWGLAVAHEQLRPAIVHCIKQSPLNLRKDVFLVDGQFNYELMAESRAALATSGTVTAELALHRVPTAVSFQINLLNLAIAGLVLRLKLPHYCLVNIICEKRVYPEFYGWRPSARQIAAQLLPLIGEGKRRSTCLQGCDDMRERLGSSDASDAAAQSILEILG